MTNIPKMLFAIVLAVAMYGAPAASQQPSVRDLGVPFLADTPLTRGEVRTRVHDDVMRDLSRLENWQDYSALPKHKALAIKASVSENAFADLAYRADHIDVHVSFWWAAWEWDDPTTAREKALAKCGSQCFIYFEDDKPVGLERLVDDFFAARARSLSHAREQYALADKIDLVSRAMQAIAKEKNPWALTAPAGFKVGYPDWQQDYASVCMGRIFYALREVPPADRPTLLSELNSLTESGMYDRYSRTVNTTKGYVTAGPELRSTKQMRYALEVEGARIATDDLPPNIQKALLGEQVVRIWLEGSIRVTESGLPLASDDRLSPLAVETDRAFYRGIEIRMPDYDGGCYVGYPFSNEALRFAANRHDAAGATRKLDVFLKHIRSALEKDPILATAIANEPFAPGEFGMARIKQPSVILGGPNFEESTYLVQTWSAESENPFYSLYLRESFQGVGQNSLRDVSDSKPDLRVFLKVTHIVTRARHRLGSYENPSDQEVAQFGTTVSAVVRGAIRQACIELGGAMSGEVCVVK